MVDLEQYRYINLRSARMKMAEDELINELYNARSDLADLYRIEEQQEAVIRSGKGDTAFAVEILQEVEDIKRKLNMIIRKIIMMIN